LTLKPSNYKPRLLDSLLDRRLEGFGAVGVVGAKFCGKTWTSMAHGQSIVHIDEDAVRQMVLLDASLALSGNQPHVIDEWQDVPKIWDAVRRKVDESGNQRGQFILTGSSTVDKSKVSHSGAGRIAKMHMRPMSLFESGNSDGSISLNGLFEGEFKTQQVTTDVRELARLICLGGWPAGLDSSEALLGDLPAQYLEALFSVSASKRNLDQNIARKAAVSLARNAGKTLTYKTFYADVFETEPPASMDQSLFRQALDPYLRFFKDQYFIEDQNGWDAPIKSRSRVRSKPRRTFADPSLPAALLNQSPDRLLHEVQLFGNLFEELCLRDIRVYASAMQQMPEPSIYYYADADGLEVDIVIELLDGRWGAFEIKLSEEKVPEAQKSLLRLRNKVVANPAAKNREPSFLAVLVGKATFSRQTPEGVYVIPLTTLTV
jgi:predicted AAA+ superfamily ATPase